MSPRGVAIPDVREQLFRSAERVLAREGAAGLSGRAITVEAGVAHGLLHNHFSDLDEFLVAFILDRARRAVESVATLSQRAGHGTVVGNVTDAALSIEVNVPVLASLVASRPSLFLRVHEAVATGAPGLDSIEAVFAAYLDAEKQRGRVKPEADTEALAVALVATVHHLWLTQGAGAHGEHPAGRRVIAALLAGVADHRQDPAAP